MKAAGGWGSEGATWRALTSSSGLPTLYLPPFDPGHGGRCIGELEVYLSGEHTWFKLPPWKRFSQQATGQDTPRDVCILYLSWSRPGLHEGLCRQCLADMHWYRPVLVTWSAVAWADKQEAGINDAFDRALV